MLTAHSIAANNHRLIEVAVNKQPPRLPPGPSLPKPALIARFLLQPTSFLERCQRRYGDYFTLDLPNRTSVITSDPEAVKAVFTADPDHLLAGKNNSILQPILGDRSVLLLDGREHLRQRRLLLPPFHGERMAAYAETMREVADRGIAGWPRGRPFATQPSMQAITLEVILRTVFGLTEAERVKSVGGPLRRVLDATASMPRLLALQLTSSKDPRRLSPWGRFNALVAEADRVVYEEIAARRAEADGEHTDVLSLLLAARDEEGNALTDTELRDELMTLVLAGHETTATALAWTLERLVRNPEVLDRLLAEHRAGETEFVDATIKESLRLRPVVPAVGRYLTAPFELGEHLLPAEVNLNLSIHLLHRRADLYPEPAAFRPERFLERKPGTYEWIPFGGGTRRCLGASFALLEMRIVLQAILDQVSLRPCDESDERVGRRAVTLVPKRGARIAVEAI